MNSEWEFRVRGIVFTTVLIGALLATPLAANSYELRAPTNPVLNSANRDLNTVRSWVYVLSADDQVENGNWIATKDFPIQVVDHSQYPYEMIVTFIRPGPWIDTENWTDAFLNADNIRTWQNSTPEGKLVLASIGIGTLHKDHYFNGVSMSARSSWTDANGNPTGSAPPWLLCTNPTYPGLNWVAF